MRPRVSLAFFQSVCYWRWIFRIYWPIHSSLSFFLHFQLHDDNLMPQKASAALPRASRRHHYPRHPGPLLTFPVDIPGLPDVSLLSIRFALWKTPCLPSRPHRPDPRDRRVSCWELDVQSQGTTTGLSSAGREISKSRSVLEPPERKMKHWAINAAEMLSKSGRERRVISKFRSPRVLKQCFGQPTSGWDPGESPARSSEI